MYAHDERIQPDQYVRPNFPSMGTDSDPVLQAGVEWLGTQPQCSR